MFTSSQVENPSSMQDDPNTTGQLFQESVVIRNPIASSRMAGHECPQTNVSFDDPEHRYYRFLENSVAGVFRIAPNGRYVYANSIVVNTLGYQTSQELINAVDHADAQFYVDASQYHLLIQTLAEKDVVQEFECQLYRKDGNVIWVSKNIRAVRDQANTLLYYEGICIDITKRKHIEAELYQAKVELERKVEERTAALRESNDQLIEEVAERRQAELAFRAAKVQLEAVLEAVPGIVSWISSDLRYLGVNQRLAKTFNLPPEAFVNQDIGFLHTSSEFNTFVRDFFASPAQDAFREVAANVHGTLRNFLIVAQKYDHNRAAFTVGIDITERKQAESALKQAEAKYRAIFENAVEGVFQSTLDGHYISANPALARIYGYNSPQELTASLTSIQKQLYVDPNRRSEFISALQKNDAVIGFESQVYRKDGRLTWISENARAVRDETGALLYYEGTVEDITERRDAQDALHKAKEELESRVEERTRALQDLNTRLMSEISERQRIEAALRNSEAELRALFAAMTDYIVVFDAQGTYLKMVSTNTELSYQPDIQRIGKTVYEVLPEWQASLFVIYIQRALNTRQTVNLEYSLPVHNPDQLPDSTLPEAWFSASVSPMPANQVIWVARDITERKQAESALRQAEEKYRSIFENAAEGIFQTTPSGIFISANPALVDMYGYRSVEELRVELPDARHLYIDPDRRSEFIRELERHDAIFNFESEIRRRDGSIIWTSENARAVRDADGELLYYEGTVEDITERKQTEIALQAEQEKSERLLLNILPMAIAEQLKQQPSSIADRFDDVTILFADIVDFTSLSARVQPTELVNLLNDIFSSFDQLADHHQLEKIKTIGDAYMVVGGLPTSRPDHALAIAEMALDMQTKITRFKRDNGEPFQLRIGIHTGPVVAGVIGIKKFIYDLWGDTVNVASRMEAQGMGGKIQVTQDFFEKLNDYYQFETRGLINVKGRGEMMAYWLTDRKTSR
ncbi:MAG: PAS domain S-box protein [Elainellaceae cyanobacterium]